MKTIHKGLMGLKPINTKRADDPPPAMVKEEVVEPLSPGARLFHAPQLNCCIIAEMGCKTNIDVEVLKEGAKETLLKHPRFSSKLVFDAKGKPIGWVRTQVNLDDHHVVPEIDPNIESPDQFVEDYVSNITKTPLDFSKPPWEVHILHIKTSKANSVGIFRLHHSMGDGISLISLLLACTRKSSDPNALPSLPVDKKKKTIALQASQVGFLGYFLFIWVFLRVLWNTLVHLIIFTATTLFLKDTNTPLKGKPGIEKSPKRFVNKHLSLDDIRFVKNAMDLTINDVVLGITQAGLTRYLHRKYDNAKEDGEAQKAANRLKNIRLRANVLVNLRPTTTIEGLAEMMEGESKKKWNWGNEIAYILLPFHIGMKNDPLDYLRDAKVTIDKKKRSLEAICTYTIAKFILNTFGLWVTAKLIYRVLSHTTMSFSNVVGPMEEISFYGHPMAYLAPSVYGHPQALTIHFQSYMDMMTVVLAVDPNVIPDPHKLCDDIAESLKLVKDTIIERKLVKS